MTTPQEFFSLLSDETRLRCLSLLKQKREVCVCEFCSILRSIQPKISRHLAHLRRAGLVIDERKGQWVYYRLNPDLEKWKKKILNVCIENLLTFEPYISDSQALGSTCSDCT